jgi:type IV pilus assembly protein PilW
MKCTTADSRQTGFTIIELMIALVLGLIVIGGSLALFASQRATSGLSAQMSDVQAEGRVALDALARDFRAGGDFGCWPVSTPIDGRMNQTVFNEYAGGVVGYDAGSGLPATSTTLYGLSTVRAALPSDSSVVILTGVNGTLTQLAQDMTTQADNLVVTTPKTAFAAHDVAVVTDCITWAKFQVTDVTAASSTTTSLAHTGGVLSDVWGQGNVDGNLGAVFKKDSTVGRLDSVWWYVGASGGLYRMSARDGAPVLVSKRVYAMKITYDVDSDSNGVIASSERGKTASSLASTDWPKVRGATIQLLMRSEKIADSGVPSTYTTFAGVTIPSDKHVYLPLQVSVALRNQQ